MREANEVLEESRGGIPTGTYVEQLVKHQDGAITARGDLTEEEITVLPEVQQYHMSEVRTTNPAHAWKLLNYDDFEPHLYRCTFRASDLELNEGFDYSIGFLSEESINGESIEIDDVLGVDGRLPGTPSEAIATLRTKGIGDVLEVNEERFV